MSRKAPSKKSSSIPKTPSVKTFRMLTPKFKPSYFADGKAPASVSQSSNSRYAYTRGSLTGKNECHFCLPLARANLPADGLAVGGCIPGFILIGSRDGSTTQANQAYTLGLNPWRMPFYRASTVSSWDTGIAFPLGPQLSFAAASNGQFRWKKLIFHYEPTYTTASDANFVFAFSRDPANSAFGVSQNTNAAFPNQASLLLASSSIAFAPWIPWSMEVEVDSTQKYKRFPAVYGNNATAVYTDNDMRFANAGCISLIVNKSNGTNSESTGVIYMEGIVEFDDPVPVTTSYPLVSALLFDHEDIDLMDTKSCLGMKFDEAEVKEESKEVKDEMGLDVNTTDFNPVYVSVSPPVSSVNTSVSTPIPGRTVPVSVYTRR